VEVAAMSGELDGMVQREGVDATRQLRGTGRMTRMGGGGVGARRTLFDSEVAWR
jgi:hypothetical protein